MVSSARLWLADEVWLVTHDDHSGARRMHAMATGLGLASGLLAELVVAEHLDIEDGRLFVLGQLPPQASPGRDIVGWVVAEPQVLLPDWLAFLARDAEGRVADRLWRSGIVHRSQPGGGRAGRDGRSWWPVDPNVAAWPEARLHTALGRGERLGLHDVVLAGLVWATGLGRSVLYRADPAFVDHLVSRLPAGLRELVAATGAAVAHATLTHHRGSSLS